MSRLGAIGMLGEQTRVRIPRGRLNMSITCLPECVDRPEVARSTPEAVVPRDFGVTAVRRREAFLDHLTSLSAPRPHRALGGREQRGAVGASGLVAAANA